MANLLLSQPIFWFLDGCFKKQKWKYGSIDDASKCNPVLSECAKALEGWVKETYLQKILVIGVDPASIPMDQFSPQCLPPVKVLDLLSYLVLETSYYTNQQFKALKSLEAFNQIVLGFVTSVVGTLIAGKYVLRAHVRHSQQMNDPLVNIWIITKQDGTVLFRMQKLD